jgi:hypothetical protein
VGPPALAIFPEAYLLAVSEDHALLAGSGSSSARSSRPARRAVVASAVRSHSSPFVGPQLSPTADDLTLKFAQQL